MNIQSAANNGLLFQEASSMSPQSPQFDFEQWASAVRKQMQTVVTQKLIVPSTYPESPLKESH